MPNNAIGGSEPNVLAFGPKVATAPARSSTTPRGHLDDPARKARAVPGGGVGGAEVTHAFDLISRYSVELREVTTGCSIDHDPRKRRSIRKVAAACRLQPAPTESRYGFPGGPAGEILELGSDDESRAPHRRDPSPITPPKGPACRRATGREDENRDKGCKATEGHERPLTLACDFYQRYVMTGSQIRPSEATVVSDFVENW